MAKDKQAELQKTIEELALETELFEGRCQDRYIEKFKTILQVIFDICILVYLL